MSTALEPSAPVSEAKTPPSSPARPKVRIPAVRLRSGASRSRQPRSKPTRRPMASARPSLAMIWSIDISRNSAMRSALSSHAACFDDNASENDCQLSLNAARGASVTTRHAPQQRCWSCPGPGHGDEHRHHRRASPIPSPLPYRSLQLSFRRFRQLRAIGKAEQARTGSAVQRSHLFGP